MTYKTIIKSIGVLVIILSVFPFIPLDHWTIRIFDFPHIQLTILTLITLLIFLINYRIKDLYDTIIAVSLILCFIFQLSKVYPYTFLADYEVLPAEKNHNNETLGIFTANVYQSNKKSKELFSIIKKKNPELILLTETNKRWCTEVKEAFSKEYPYRIEVPFENTYGMFLLSKLSLVDSTVKFLVEDTIPSIHTKLKMPNGSLIQLIAIHPPPPTPIHNPSSADRDSEMMQVAELSRTSSYPTIVMGDFNDVAWSETTDVFQEVSKLLDMRIGRGFYNTYNAKNPILRWPLDHVFVSSEFRILGLEKGKAFGSDHFPFYAQLSLEPTKSLEQEPDAPTKKELQKAKNQIETTKEK